MGNCLRKLRSSGPKDKHGNKTNEEQQQKYAIIEYEQAQVHIVKHKLPIFINLRKRINLIPLKDSDLGIWDCIITNSQLVFTDCRNNRLIICFEDGSGIRYLPLSWTPNYITEVAINIVAVSSPLDKTIVEMSISKGYIIRKIRTSKECEGLSCYKNKLYAVIGNEIHEINQEGIVTRTIPLPSDNIYYITVDKDKLFYTDYTTLYCCNLDGKVIWLFENEENKYLKGITTDNEGSIYVACHYSNDVIWVSYDGEKHRKFFIKSDGLKYPTGIQYDKGENILLVSNFSDNMAFVFEVKYK